MNVSAILRNVSLSGLDTWGAFNVVRPIGNYSLETLVGLDKLVVNTTFGFNVSATTHLGGSTGTQFHANDFLPDQTPGKIANIVFQGDPNASTLSEEISVMLELSPNIFNSTAELALNQNQYRYLISQLDKSGMCPRSRLYSVN